MLALYATSPPPRTKLTHVVAALANASIIPYTALYMEPGINGAGNWKAQELLRDEGFELQAKGTGTNKDTARASAKEWATTVAMKNIAETWANTNAWRYVITGIATIINASATTIRGRRAT